MTDKQNNAGQMDGQKNNLALAHLTMGSHVASLVTFSPVV